MRYVYVGKENHDVRVYATALACLKARYESGVYAFDPDEDNRADKVRRIIENGFRAPEVTEELAWKFLQRNVGLEYEGVTCQPVIE